MTPRTRYGPTFGIFSSTGRRVGGPSRGRTGRQTVRRWVAWVLNPRAHLHDFLARSIVRHVIHLRRSMVGQRSPKPPMGVRLAPQVPLLLDICSPLRNSSAADQGFYRTVLCSPGILLREPSARAG